MFVFHSPSVSSALSARLSSPYLLSPGFSMHQMQPFATSLRLLSIAHTPSPRFAHSLPIPQSAQHPLTPPLPRNIPQNQNEATVRATNPLPRLQNAVFPFN